MRAGASQEHKIATRLDPKAVTLLNRSLDLFHPAHVRPSGPAMQQASQFGDAASVSGAVPFHPPVVQVARITAQPQSRGGALRKVAEAHALHTPPHEPLARDVWFCGHSSRSGYSPGGRRLCQSVRLWNPAPTASSRFSEYGAPTTCSATGRLSAKPHGSTMAGSPARLPAGISPARPCGVPAGDGVAPRSSG